MRSATPVGGATTRRRRVCPASSAARHRCRRIEHCFATVTSLMPAPAFSRLRTVVPSIRRRAASPGPCAALSVESPRLPFFDGSRHKASPPANWFNRAHRPAVSKRRSAASKRQWAPQRIAPGDRRDGAGTSPGARESVAAVRRGRRWICATPRRDVPPNGRSASTPLAQLVRHESALVSTRAHKHPRDTTSARSSPCRIPSS